MPMVFETQLAFLQRHPHLLKGGLIGVERETLRVSPEGHIAQTPHPPILGSALTHPFITTDYSEALLEFITPPQPNISQTIQFLMAIHQYVYRYLDRELLWSTSMPCVMQGDEHIPIAYYGSSNIGQIKHIYRRGLGYRYGRMMQVIAGVHFNYSLPEAVWPILQDAQKDQHALTDFISNRYFGLIRNLQRFGWLIPYLFGASPAVCKSFLAGKPTWLSELDPHTYFAPYGTSLRMSDIGYTNRREKATGLNVSYNNLADYIKSLQWAMRTPCPDYEKIGVLVDGEYRQLNANILQIENEYYSTVRPKRISTHAEKPLAALQRGGVQYIELRSTDVDVFSPIGINEMTLHFLETFLIFCLLYPSPLIDTDEKQEIDENQLTVANQGRHPETRLWQRGKSRTLKNWSLELIDYLQEIGTLLEEPGATNYQQAILHQREAILHPELTPSARMIAEMREHHESFFEFAKRWSETHHRDLLLQPVNNDLHYELARQTVLSLQRQQEIESNDQLAFESYLQSYLAQT